MFPRSGRDSTVRGGRNSYPRSGDSHHRRQHQHRGTVFGRGLGQQQANGHGAHFGFRNDNAADDHKSHMNRGNLKDYDDSYTSGGIGLPSIPKQAECFRHPTPAGKMVRKPSKMGRIILRNLPFSTKEDDLRTLMGKCGKIVEVRIPVKDDGKMKGFAFVQFQSINSAELAIQMFNATKLKDRPIAVDWAVAKSRYEEAKLLDHNAIKLKQESQDEAVEKTEDSDATDLSLVPPPEINVDSASESSSSEEEKEEEKTENSSDNETTEGDLPKKKKPRTSKKISDVEEGRTLFLRNIPYDATTESLQAAFKKMGNVRYALLCYQSDSGHPKGTGFVQYFKKDDADRCLAAANSNDGILLNDRKLVVCRAENPKQRRRTERLMSEKPKKDNRNLALLKEGKVQRGSEDLELVSQNDARKRSMLDQKKAAALKNLHMFVSTTRLSVHNIPTNVDDRQLKEIFLIAAGLKKYALKECRIIRDMHNLDSNGVGRSRGFGFLEFLKHGDAMKSLLAVNNNPTIFSSDKRPIVEFALENKAALMKKQKRLEHSKAKLSMLKNSSMSAAGDNAKVKRTSKSDKKIVNSVTKPTPGGLNNIAPRKPQAKLKTRGTAEGKMNSSSIDDTDGSKSIGEAEPSLRIPKNKATQKKRKREAPEAADDFSLMVEKYKNKLLKTDAVRELKSLRWFDG